LLQSIADLIYFLHSGLRFLFILFDGRKRGVWKGFEADFERAMATAPVEARGCRCGAVGAAPGEHGTAGV
jgi:hypothetical protein